MAHQTVDDWETSVCWSWGTWRHFKSFGNLLSFAWSQQLFWHYILWTQKYRKISIFSHFGSRMVTISIIIWKLSQIKCLNNVNYVDENHSKLVYFGFCFHAHRHMNEYRFGFWTWGNYMELMTIRPMEGVSKNYHISKPSMKYFQTF